MPTFKLDDTEDDLIVGYAGSSDMYFRQWRAPSMQPILNKKLDKDFLDAGNQRETEENKRAEMRRRHNERFEKKLLKMKNEFVKTSVNQNKPFLRAPTEKEKKQYLEAIENEFKSPSSTARMVPAKQLPLRPKVTPMFGSSFQNGGFLKAPTTTLPAFPPNTLKSLNLNVKINEKKELVSTPKENSFLNNSQESVFFPQKHNSFNLDSYNGTRPSFAFAGLSAATSTPVSKVFPKFSVGSEISEESSFLEESQYVTALESPSVSVDQVRRSREIESEETETRINDQIEEKKAEKIETLENVPPKPAFEDTAKKVGKCPGNIFSYIALKKKIMQQKMDYEEKTDVSFLSLIKRTITEKVTVFTQRITPNERRNEIVNFFKTLLKKEPVKGFSKMAVVNGEIIKENVELKLNVREDVEYAVYCIIEKYMSLAELDDELTTSISDLIFRLSASSQLFHRMFICLILNESVILRQNLEECKTTFIDTIMDSNSKTFLLNKEMAIASLFLNVFAKCAVMGEKWQKLDLTKELLWTYAESVLENALLMPKSAVVLNLLITVCKTPLRRDLKKWEEFMRKLNSEVLPQLEKHHFEGDDSCITILRNCVDSI